MRDVAAPGGRARRPRRRARRPAASASATRCWRRRSTRRSCPASARSCTRGSRKSSRAAEPRRGGARAALGGGGSQHRGARRLGRGGTRGGGRLRPGGGARAPRAGARALGRGAGRRRARPGSTSPSSAPGRPSSPARSAPPPRAVELGRRAIELVGEGDPHRAALLHVRLGEYLVRDRQRRRVPRRVRACGRARAGRAALTGARVCAGVARGRVDGGLAPRGVVAGLRGGARARSRGRRTRGGGPGAHGARHATSPTSAAARRGSPSSGRRWSSPRRSAIASAWSERTSISPMR